MQTKQETSVIHSGKVDDTTFRSVMPPLYSSSIFTFESVGKEGAFEYSRSGNPTRLALENCIAELEGGVDAVCTATGMAAVTGVLHMLKPGDHVITGNDIYGGTYRLMHDVFSALGIDFSFVDMHETDNVRAALRDETRMIWIETPSNPMLRLSDIAAITGLVKGRDVMVVADNTFPSPVFQQPIALGVDVVVHSTTKYINGHSDVIGGAIVCADDALAERVRFLTNACGLTESPWDAWLVLRGIRTLPQRMRAHAEGALQIAQYLRGHNVVRRVYYPGLPEHPQYELAQRQMRGAGGVVTFELDADQERLDAFFSRLRLFPLAVSLGGVESLIEAPWFMSHMSMSVNARKRAGISPGTVRISVGIEAPADLIADLEQGLSIL